MKPRIRIPHRWFFGVLLLFGLGLVLAFPAESDGQQATSKAAATDQQIADVEKQIADLQKKLEELRRAKEPVATESTFPADWLKALTWRSIGPANMGGRITAISVFDLDPSTYWVATASGGLLKTTNNGITYEHQFDREATVSIGDVCVAPSDRNVVYVGTGESNPRNSVSYGDGVYKSTDGGKTWTNMGLKKSFQIGKIVIHPKDPDTVYVGVLGRLYGPSEERGLFKTTDGGKTWQRIFYLDDKTGVIDMRMHPHNPETLIVATWERQRDGFDRHFGPFEGDMYGPAKTWAPGTGLFKTTDGGKTFKKLVNGLPACNLGRIGIDYFRKDPNILYAIIDSEKVGGGPARAIAGDAFMAIQGEKAEGGAKLTTVTPDGPAENAGLKPGDIITALADKPIRSYEELTEQIRARKPGEKVKVKLTREKKDMEVEVTFGARPVDTYSGLFGEEVEGGLRLRFVVAGGPAEQAGLEIGDVVVAFAGKEIRSIEDLQDETRARKPGDKVKVKVLRGKDTKEVELTLQTRPERGFGGGGERVDPNRPYGASLGGQRENVQDRQGPEGFQYGGVYKSTDGGETWNRINSLNPRPMYFSQIRVDPSDYNYVYVLGVALYRSNDGGKTFRGDGGRGTHADHHALWIDPRDSRHMVLGNDGGHYVTYDRMANWDHHNTLALGQFYHVALDPRRPYKAYGGLQDNGSWGGPAQTRSSTGPINEDWISVGGGDGFVCRVDPNDPDLVYSTSQNGALGRRNLRTGETASIRPPRQPGQPTRFNWNTPFILSSHNSRIYYCAGNYVYRSLDRGNNLQQISPEITASKVGSATALAESPRNPNVLYVGTDDGALWVTRDAGKEWTNITPLKSPPSKGGDTGGVGLPGLRWVATIEASRYEEGRAYVVLDGHRSNDDSPYAYVTEDFGKTWKSLNVGLPWGSTRCLREDIQNPNLLYLGTEFAFFASLDRGASWHRINNNLPTVAVHEIAIHPTAGEIVAATHGRSLWVLDVTALRQMTPDVLKAQTHLFKPNTAIRWQTEPSRGRTNRRFVGENPQQGAHIYYALGKKPDKISLKVLDIEGKVVRELQAPSDSGMHRIVWNLTRTPPRQPGEGGQPGGRRGGGQQPSGTGVTPVAPQPGGARGAAQPGTPGGTGTPTGPPSGGFGGRFGGGGLAVAPGMYRIVLTVDGQELSQSLRVESDPAAPPGLIAEPEEPEPVIDPRVIDD